jgi:hypothetical protein
MCLPVAIAAGEANLAIDEANEDGDWTATGCRGQPMCEVRDRDGIVTYTAAAIAAQPFAKS